MTNTELADLLEEAARRLRGNSPIGEAKPSLQLYTETEAASLLRVSRNTVRKNIPQVRLSKQGTRYRASDIEAYIKSKDN